MRLFLSWNETRRLRRPVTWALIPFVLLWACGGDAQPGTSVPADGTTAAGPTTASPTPTPDVTSTTAATPPADPWALTEPTEVQIDGRCNVGVYREDETGTTWLLSCGVGSVGQHLAVRQLDFASHFRYVVDENDVRTDVLIEVLAVLRQECLWGDPEFAPFKVPITNGVVTFEGSAEGSQRCDGMLLTYEVVWDLESGEIVIDGLLEPVG